MFNAALVAVLLANPQVKDSALKPIPIQQVHIDDQFWAPKLKVWQDVTIRDCFAKFEKDGALANFDAIAGGASGEHGGPPWYDGLIYEMITGSADFLAANPNAKLEARIDGYIDRIASAAARDPDGYLNTYTQLKEPNHRWGQNGGNDRWQHDLYNAGAMVEAGVHYYRATGKTKLLKVATRVANLMSATMGPLPRQNIIPGHALGEKSLTSLYELYEEQPQLKAQISGAIDDDSYLQLAQFWIDARGHHERRTNFGTYDQDEIPVLQQETIEGHAVRAMLLCCGLLAAGRSADRPAYLDEAQRLWDNMVARRMYITGGVGANREDEKFGSDFFLPNDGYSETCAAVGAAFFHELMALQFANGKYADELERALYNGVLSGVSVSGDRYFYENPLVSGKNRVRWSWHGCPCCPPMFLKAMGALPGLIYAQDSDDLCVNLYVGNEARTKVGGSQVSLRQVTNYPCDGLIRLAVEPVHPVRFALHLRIPGWSKDAQLRVNGQLVPDLRVNLGYAVVDRVWKEGDHVELNLPMPIERVHADPRVEADRGRLALRRGPIVYCLEGIDNRDDVGSLVIDSGAPLGHESRKSNALGSYVAITGHARRVESAGESRESFLAIPYYLNTNRAPSDMAVWVAEAPSVAKPCAPISLASSARASASHCNPSDTVLALNDRVAPSASDDTTMSRFTWWDHRGTSEWVQYDFDSPKKLSSVLAYWWDERRIRANCRVPQSWQILYWTGNGWKPVEGNPVYGTDMDRYNRADFSAVITRSLRVQVQLQPGWSAGLLKLLVY